jgi:hypothetical protein
VPQFKYVASGSYVIASDGTGVGPVGYQVSVTSRSWSGSVVFAQNIAPPGSVPNYVNVAYQDANTGTEFAAGVAITGTAAIIISPTVGDLIAVVTVTTGEVIINVNPATQGVTNRELRNAFVAAGYDTAGQDTTEAMLSVAVAGMLGQVLDVRAFGAVGDGVTDDTAAIQRAIDAAEAVGGGIVLIPEGLFSAELVLLRDNVVVCGVGPSSIVRQRTYTASVANPAFIIDTVQGAGVCRMTLRGRVGTQHDLTGAPVVDGMQAAEYAGLILVRGATDTLIENVRCETFVNGIVVWQSEASVISSHTTIRGLTVEDIGLAGVLTAYNEYLTISDVYGKNITNTQSRAQHVLYLNLQTDYFHVSNVQGEDITDQVLDLSGLPSVLQIKGRYGTARGITGTNVPSLVTMASAVQCVVSHVSGTCAIVGAPGTDEAAVYMSSGDRNIVSDVTVACTNKPAIHAQSEDGTVVKNVVAAIATTSATIRGIYILGGQYTTVTAPNIVFSGSGGVGVEFAGGIVNSALDVVVTSGTTGISVLSGVNQATVSYIPRLVGATTKFSNAGTSTVRVVPPLTGAVAWDPASIPPGTRITNSLTVTGAIIGQPVIAGFSQNLAGLVLTGYVEATNTVAVVLQNPTGGAVDLASGTLTAAVLQV